MCSVLPKSLDPDSERLHLFARSCRRWTNALFFSGEPFFYFSTFNTNHSGRYKRESRHFGESSDNSPNQKTKGEFICFVLLFARYSSQSIVPRRLFAPDLSCAFLATEQQTFFCRLRTTHRLCLAMFLFMHVPQTSMNGAELMPEVVEHSRSTPSILKPVEFHHHGPLSSPRNANTSRSATMIEYTSNAVNT